jgi:hypothetical protein
MIFLVAFIYLAGFALYWSRWTGFLRFVGLPIDWKVAAAVSVLWPLALVYEELL